MFPIFKDLFSPLQNCEEVTTKLCKLLKIKSTTSSIVKEFEEHPDYPSLLSVSDVLYHRGVENLSIKVSTEEVLRLSTPFIAQIKVEKLKHSYFTIVSKIDSTKVTYLNPQTHKDIIEEHGTFYNQFTGIVLLAEPTKTAGEKNFSKHLQEEKRQTVIKTLTAVILPILTLLVCTNVFLNHGPYAIAAVIYTFLTLIGTITAVLLLWYEIDQYNPALQKICSTTKKINCNAILHSKASKIFGISWSAIGLSYFAGSLISLLITSVYNLSHLFILSWINIIALPYIVFSIYYQWKIAKQWCALCLTIQGILASQFIIALIGGFQTLMEFRAVTFDTLLPIAVCFLIPTIIISLLLPVFKKAKESKENKTALVKLKHNPQIFEALLTKQKPIKVATDGLGITIGSSFAPYKLIKICNTYCRPCAEAHPAIEELIRNNPNIQVQIIFATRIDELTSSNEAVKHLLAIAEKKNEQLTQQALDDWYLAEKKDYNVFAKKYPMNGELNRQGDKIIAMRNWCNTMEVEFTPTFFVNGYQLPTMYNVTDLKYFLSV
jgi:uncharacterized membrane protein